MELARRVVLSATVALVLSVARCARTPARDPETLLTIATGGQGGAFYPLAVELARLYSSRIPGVVTRLESGGSMQNVEAVQDGRAQIGFTQSDVAYAAYRLGSDTNRQPFLQLRGLALLWTNTLHLAVRQDGPVHSVADLRGRRVSVGTPGSGSEQLARIVLKSYELEYTDIHAQFLSFVQTTDQMRKGLTDAAFVVAGVPTEAIMDLSARPGLRLIPIPREHVTTMRAQYPFLQRLVVPHGTYRGLDRDVETLGVSNVLACRQDLDEKLVYQLTKVLFEALPQLAHTQPVARLIDLEQAPATPIPLHPGAARYYRERELTQ